MSIRINCSANYSDKQTNNQLASSPYLVMVSISVRKVIETTRLDNQLTEADRELPVDLAHSGYISALIVHGMDPIPTECSTHTLFILSIDTHGQGLRMLFAFNALGLLNLHEMSLHAYYIALPSRPLHYCNYSSYLAPYVRPTSERHQHHWSAFNHQSETMCFQICQQQN